MVCAQHLRTFFRTYPEGHPKRALKQAIWNEALEYEGPQRHTPKFYQKLMDKVNNAKPKAWLTVSLCVVNNPTPVTYIKNRWGEFISMLQTYYQATVTKKNFSLFCGQWLMRKHHADRGRKGNDTCALSTVQLWATALCKAYTVYQNANRNVRFTTYGGLAVKKWFSAAGVRNQFGPMRGLWNNLPKTFKEKAHGLTATAACP